MMSYPVIPQQSQRVTGRASQSPSLESEELCHDTSLQLPVTGEYVTLSYCHDCKARRAIEGIDVNKPASTIVIQRACASDLSRFPGPLTATGWVDGYGKDAVVGITNIRIAVRAQVTESFCGISRMINFGGEVRNTLACCLKQEPKTGFCGWRALNINDDAGS
jgi:hypothetical protein